jgi:hypothetical protein
MESILVRRSSESERRRLSQDDAAGSPCFLGRSVGLVGSLLRDRTPVLVDGPCPGKRRFDHPLNSDDQICRSTRDRRSHFELGHRELRACSWKAPGGRWHMDPPYTECRAGRRVPYTNSGPGRCISNVRRRPCLPQHWRIPGVHSRRSACPDANRDDWKPHPPCFDLGSPMRRQIASDGLVLLLAFVAGCGPVRGLDASLRRFDILDRFFNAGVAPPAASQASEASVTAPPAVGGTGPSVAPGAQPPPAPDLSAASGPDRPGVTPEPPAGPEPRGDSGPALGQLPDARIRLVARQNPWLTQFWAELIPSQQQRVEQAFRRAARLPADAQLAPAAPWDAMGLADRVRLVFGSGGAPEGR